MPKKRLSQEDEPDSVVKTIAFVIVAVFAVVIYVETRVYSLGVRMEKVEETKKIIDIKLIQLEGVRREFQDVVKVQKEKIAAASAVNWEGLEKVSNIFKKKD